jgi:hypothetical protein
MLCIIPDFSGVKTCFVVLEIASTNVVREVGGVSKVAGVSAACLLVIVRHRLSHVRHRRLLISIGGAE